MSKKKIMFFLPSLKAGGAERVMSFVAQNVDRSKYEVTFVVIGFEIDKVYVTNNMSTIYLNKGRISRALWQIIKQIRENSPHIVVSSIIHLNILMGLLGFFFTKINFIGREASIISARELYDRKYSKVYLFLIKLFYKRLSKIVCQSQDMYDDFICNFKIKPSKLVIINNPITQDYNLPNYVKTNSVVQFVTVGRLSEEKGYERLLKCLSKITAYNFHYTIIGDGHLKDRLMKLVDKLGLKSRITFVYYTSTVLELLSMMDFFLQGSYVEGFPNGALESCTVGTPVIAFNAPGGTKEIIKDGVNGFIVDDEEAYMALLNNKEKITSLERSSVKQFVINKFNPQNIITQYEKVFDSYGKDI